MEKRRQDLKSKVRKKRAKAGEREQRKKMNPLGSSLRAGTNHPISPPAPIPKRKDAAHQG